MAFYRRQVTKMCAFSKNNYATRNFRMIFFCHKVAKANRQGGMRSQRKWGEQL